MFPMGEDQGQLRQRDVVRFHEAFYRSFDYGLAVAALRKVASGTVTLPLLGEGIHFRVFRLDVKEPLSLVLKDAKFAEKDARRSSAVVRWTEAMRSLKGLRLNLIPPFEIVREEERVGLVMPYGEEEWGRVLDHWLPLEPQVAKTLADLNDAGLAIDDQIQGRSWRGVPFICDLSDVIKVSR